MLIFFMSDINTELKCRFSSSRLNEGMKFSRQFFPKARTKKVLFMASNLNR
jgi:hypothetical protein